MKHCNKCNLIKFETEFAKKDGGFSSYCKECHKVYSRQHYINNKTKYIVKAKKQTENLRSWLKDIKQTLVCECGENNPICLEFHHIDSKTKDFNISQGIYRGKKRLLEEMAKCKIVCANCHAKIHHMPE